MSYLKFDKNLMINLEQSLPERDAPHQQIGCLPLHYNCGMQHPQAAWTTCYSDTGDGRQGSRAAFIAR